MELIVKGKRAECPICHGVVYELFENTLYRCHDCRILYKVTDKGYAESALTVKVGI
jgi:uncharacterized protein (DUF983 family)